MRQQGAPLLGLRSHVMTSAIHASRASNAERLFCEFSREHVHNLPSGIHVEAERSDEVYASTTLCQVLILHGMESVMGNGCKHRHHRSAQRAGMHRLALRIIAVPLLLVWGTIAAIQFCRPYIHYGIRAVPG